MHRCAVPAENVSDTAWNADTDRPTDSQALFSDREVPPSELSARKNRIPCLTHDWSGGILERTVEKMLTLASLAASMMTSLEWQKLSILLHSCNWEFCLFFSVVVDALLNVWCNVTRDKDVATDTSIEASGASGSAHNSNRRLCEKSCWHESDTLQGQWLLSYTCGCRATTRASVRVSVSR